MPEEKIPHVIYLPLTQGKWAIVDSDVSPEVFNYKWHVCCHNPKARNISQYAATHWIAPDGRRTNKQLHQFLFGGSRKDHINGDGLDNRRENVRAATKSQNGMNSRKRAGTTSRFKGVWKNHCGYWCAEITVRGKKTCLGSFVLEEDAAKAYDSAAKQYFGEYAKTNF